MVGDVELRVLFAGPCTRHEVEACLIGRGVPRFDLTHVRTFEQIAGELGGGRFDAVLLDLSERNEAVAAPIEAVRRTAPATPIVVLTGPSDPGGFVAARAGATECVARACLAAGYAAGPMLLRRALWWAVERARTARELDYLAHHDPLTGLLNRSSLLDALTRASARVRRGQLGLGVLFVDLDRFKRINDQHGHAAGDRVLRAAAQGMRSCLRESDSVARLGGDEFAVLVEDLGSAASLVTIAAKLRRALALLCEERELRCSASIGAVFVPPGSTAAPQVVLTAADTAMYRIKRKGGNGCEVCGYETHGPAAPLSIPPADEGNDAHIGAGEHQD